MTTARVVCISWDVGISEARCVALKKAGYEVDATTCLDHAQAAVRKQRTDVLVIGHHFLDNDSNALIEAARRIWAASVVVITGMGAPADARADVSVSILDGARGPVRGVDLAVARMVAEETCRR